MSQRKRDFTLRQLSSFVAAARSGSFALAADQLGISQPAISDHISTLEQHLGHALFERRRGTTPKLTPEGLEMLDRAESLLRTSEAMRGSRARIGSDGRVRIRLSVGPRTREVYLKPLLPRIYADHPNIEIELVPVLPIKEVPAALAKNEIDLLVYTVGAVPHSIPNVHLIADLPVDIVVSPDLAARLENGRLRIENVPFILPCNSLIYDNWLERQLVAAGIHNTQPIRYVEFPDILQAMIETGAGASVLMHEQVEEALVAGRLVALTPKLDSMKRILIRAPGAPRETAMLEQDLLHALLPAVPTPAFRDALELQA
ncbi:MAG: LysR family transcriptional regulator [Sphingobium sp.]|nr:LysR family transcriptional regulator [Sphingobium sp.]